MDRTVVWNQTWRPGQDLGAIVTKAMKWSVGAGRDFEVEDTGAWDGQAAQNQIFSWAGWPDNPEPAKARRCFLMYSPDDPELRGSYKYPICVIRNGKPVVSRAGMAAAAGYLPKGKGFSPETQNAARAVLDHYYKKAKEKEGA